MINGNRPTIPTLQLGFNLTAEQKHTPKQVWASACESKDIYQPKLRMMMSEVYLLTGGNLGNRLENLRLAEAAIGSKVGKVVQRSSIYETAAWGITDQPPFLNQVLLVQTALAPEAVLKTLLAIENEMGRQRMVKYGARSIDLDILFYDNKVIDNEHLTIPHPALHLRRFVLVPLAELAPAFVHPVLQSSMTQLLQNCQDPLDVKKF